MRVLLASRIHPEAVEVLRERHDVVCAFDATERVLRQVVRDREVLVFRSGVTIDAALMERAPDLQLLIRAGSGLDNLDLGYVERRGIELVRVPGPGARAVAEMAFALMLMLSRNLIEADRSMRLARWAKHELNGYLLQGKTLGIVGLGNIGRTVAGLGVAWGMEVVGCDEHTVRAQAGRLLQEGVRLLGLDQVVRRADHLCIHVPLKDSTHHLIDEGVLARMKRGAYLINLSRGGVVDEKALLEALTDGDRLRGAALDVHEREGEGRLSPLAALPNVILTPHIGAMTVDTQRQIGRRIVEIVASRHRGDPGLRPGPVGVVSLDGTEMAG